MSEFVSREEELFSDALARPPAERGAFLAQACGPDEALLARLNALLAAHEQSDPLTSAGLATRPALEPEETSGNLIGHYKLLQQIGEGGCGAVWMAEQQEPVRRRVALKVIKLGMDTKAVVARFEAERQALALMDHPNIAQVYDAGATDTGRPYFVMELVRGLPITKYCDENKLTPNARLELFIKVCQAVQHAHQKGIIHRDLKPSNILVTVNDGQPTPKIIDFGIAKATQGRLTDATVFTAFEQFIGTPVYMSPEQAEMSSLDIDTRSDIYSLGVLLYELLTGQPPFDPKAFAQAGVDEVRKRIREVDPAKPSARLRTLTDEEQTTIARLRSTVPAELSIVLRGDLDWIIMRCLEKDRSRRYDTANGLALDIQRSLRHEPVIARPPSTGYLLRKLIRRHRFGFAAAAGIVAALFVGLAIALWSLVGERAARVRAVAAEREQARLRADAVESRSAAETARDREARLRVAAEAQELAAERRAYAADMNLLQQQLALGNFGRARELLNRHRPKDGERDLRGWEWRYLWQFCQGDPRTTICRLQEYGIKALSVSADGQWVAAGHNRSGDLVLRNLRTGEELRPRTGGGWVAAAFSPVAPLLAANETEAVGDGAARHSLRLWNVETRQEEQRLELAGPCLSLNFSGDGHVLAVSTGAPEHAMTFLRVPGFSRVSTCRVQQWFNDDRYCLAVTADLRLAAHHVTEDDNRVRVVDLRTGDERLTLRVAGEVSTALAFSPDGRILATGTGYSAGVIQLWDVETGHEVGRLEGHRAWIADLAFWPDGRTLVSASADRTLRVWDMANRRLVRTIFGHGGEVWRVALFPHNRLASASKDGEVNVWDLAGSTSREVNVRIPIQALDWRFAPGKASVWVLDNEGNVSEWREGGFREGVRIINVGPPHQARSVSRFSPDAPLLALGGEGVLRVWDLERRTLAREIRVAAGLVRPACFLKKGERLISLQNNRFTEWELRSGHEVASWVGPARTNRSIVMSPDERTALMFGFDGQALSRDMATGQVTSFGLSYSGYGAGGRYSSDGRYLVVPRVEGYARLWHTATWREAGTLGGFLLGVHSVAFSPDGARLATGSGGMEAVRLWDIHSQQPVLTLEGEGAGMDRTEFSADGNLLGSMSTFRRLLHLWRAPSWGEIEQVERAQVASARTP